MRRLPISAETVFSADTSSPQATLYTGLPRRCGLCLCQGDSPAALPDSVSVAVPESQHVDEDVNGAKAEANAASFMQQAALFALRLALLLNNFFDTFLPSFEEIEKSRVGYRDRSEPWLHLRPHCAYASV